MKRILKYFNYLPLVALCLVQSACQAQTFNTKNIITGAEQLHAYIPLIKDKSVALMVNQTSMVGPSHLLDTLLSSGVVIKKIFSPEHGFRGNLANGEKVPDDTDPTTGLPIISLYGKNTKPSATQLKGVDAVIYDIQDVGARFYTYISSLHYLMQACADNNIELIVLDRPNPNAHYIDGPVLEPAYGSFVGLHPIPIVYGMTIGELAQMLKGEKWIESKNTLQLSVITLKNWNHQTRYSLPVKPSPNLPNEQAVALYPSLCLFEGTNVSVGRGTNSPFQVIGFPDKGAGPYQFTPKSIPEASKYPKHENRVCFGQDLRSIEIEDGLNLDYLIRFYQSSPDRDKFFNDFFTNLSGSKVLRRQIEKGLSQDEIKASWQEGIVKFKKIRMNYLLYE